MFKFLLFFSIPILLNSQENSWLKYEEKALDLPYPEFQADNCPKFRQNIYISDIDKTLKDVNNADYSKLTDISDDLDIKSLTKAIETNINYWQNKPDTFSVIIGKDTYSKKQMLNTSLRLLEIFKSVSDYKKILELLKNEFKIYRAVADDNTNSVTITGYYESEIIVSPTKEKDFIYPLHLKPKDLVKTTNEMNVDFDYGRYDENGNLVKYYSTQEIREGKIDNQKLEIAYSNHPSHIMLAQIQGSSILRYTNGDYIRVGFDGANGWKFQSVQKILMDCGEIPSMSFKDFIKYLSSQPQDREERLVNLNPRYIFFAVKDKNTLPYGAIGYELTNDRSIAIDPKYIPLGMVGYMKSKKPVSNENGELTGFKEFSRFVATQDTGSAIRGPGRIDLFFGQGKKAETEASSMKASGEFYLFVIKN
jgi:membrane-bound lytic murein transglycosylase A